MVSDAIERTTNSCYSKEGQLLPTLRRRRGGQPFPVQYPLRCENSLSDKIHRNLRNVVMCQHLLPLDPCQSLAHICSTLSDRALINTPRAREMTKLYPSKEGRCDLLSAIPRHITRAWRRSPEIERVSWASSQQGLCYKHLKEKSHHGFFPFHSVHQTITQAYHKV